MHRFAKSLRFKVTFLVIAVELLILTGVGVYYTHRFSQEVDSAIIARLSAPALLMSGGELSFEAVSDQSTMEGLLRAPYNKGVVVGLDGNVYFSSDPALLNKHMDEVNGLKLPNLESPVTSTDAPALITPLEDDTGVYLTSLSPLYPDGKLTGYLYLKVGTETSEAEKRDIAILFTLGSLGTILLTAAILSWLLNLGVIQRLNNLVGIFDRFSQGDYATRAQTLGSSDEIATLMTGFNDLAQRLEDTLAHLRNSETLLNNSQRLSKVGGWEVNIQSGKVFWTQELYRIHELPVDPTIDHIRESMACYRAEDRQLIGDAFQRACERGEPYDLEFPFTTSKGKPLWIRTTAQPIYEEGKVVRVIGNLMDITSRKRAEEALRLSNERLQLATHAAQIGIWDWDVVNNELLWDESMYQLYGIQSEDFGGAYDAWLQTIHPEDKTYADGEIQAALRGEHEYAPEFRIVRPDGSIRHIKADSKTILDRDGKPIRMIGTNIDITERKQSEQELRRYRDHLEETVELRTEELRLARDAAEAANKAKSVFLANMSHELRTPLNAILGFSQLMRQDMSLNPRQWENLDIINDSGKHLLKLINDVLEIAKIEAGKLQLEIATFDLQALIREVVDMMRLRAQQKGLQLQLDQSSRFPRYIKGDEARLRQILVNLISNAVKFTTQGSVTVRLDVKDGAHRHLLLEVEDSGPGISEADQQRLFKPFVQLPEGAAKGGTGLGLAIVNQFVQLMQGSIDVKSKPGVGSLFCIDLPLEEAEEAEVIRLGSEIRGDVSGLEPGHPAYRILIAEDQHENLLLLTKLMSDIGLEVKAAHNGEQCIQLFREWKPDLIWMDQRMPIMDGIEATRRIRQMPGGKEVKIIAVTAAAFNEQQAALREAGVDDYVRKPYRFNEIYDSMAQQLQLRYTYRNGAPPGKTAQQLLSPQQLATLPATLLDELRDAVESLDRERISTAIDQIKTANMELGKALVRIADEFDYPSILNAMNAVAVESAKVNQ